MNQFNSINMRYIYLLFTVILFINKSCGQVNLKVMDIDSPNKPWTNLNINDDPNNFRFVVMPDNTGAHRLGILEKGIDRINLMKPEFVVSVGDLIEGYTEDTNEIEKEWSDFNTTIQQFKMPFLYVAGNHDYSNKEMARIWKKRFGVDYYYFIYKNVLFLCLNSEDGTTSFEKADFGDAQLSFIEKILEENPKVSWTMLFMHQPLWLNPASKNWFKVEKLLANRKHSVFTGHLHQYALHEKNNSDYFVVSTMGGTSALRGKAYGEFDHFIYVSMTPEGPVYANVLLDGVEDKSIQTAENLARVESFNTNPPIRIEPYFYSGKLDKTLSYKIELKNETKEVLEYTIDLTPAKGLLPGFTKWTKKVAPGSKEEVLLPVKIINNKDFSPIIADVTLKAEKYEWKTKVNVQPNEKFFIDESSTAFKIDGDLQEWGKLRFSKKDADGKEIFRFDVRKDDKLIYLAMDVTDNDIQANLNYANLNQDAALVVFDTRPLEKSAFNQRNANGIFRGEWLFLLSSPTADNFEIGFKDKMPPGVMAKGKKTPNGYAMEYVIPQTLLEKNQGVDWKNIRLNFSIIDKNKTNDESLLRVNWTHDWMENYPGSGMFFRK